MTLEEVTTLKEAIKRLKEVIKGLRSTIQPFLYDDEAKDYIFKALEQEPCEDAVSRQVVKEKMIYYGFLAPDMTVTEFVEDCLPSVNPQKIGHWKSTIDGKPICSECDFISESLDGYFVSNYCPNCGAKMSESEE